MLVSIYDMKQLAIVENGMLACSRGELLKMVKEKAHLHISDLLEVLGNLTKGYSITAGFPDSREATLRTTEVTQSSSLLLAFIALEDVLVQPRNHGLVRKHTVLVPKVVGEEKAKVVKYEVTKLNKSKIEF